MENLKEEIYLKILALLWLQIFVYPNSFVYPGRGEGRFLLKLENDRNCHENWWDSVKKFWSLVIVTNGGADKARQCVFYFLQNYHWWHQGSRPHKGFIVWRWMVVSMTKL